MDRVLNKNTRNASALRRSAVLVLVGVMAAQLSGCYMIDFFRKDTATGGGGAGDGFSGVIGASIGAKAGGLDDAALASVHAVLSTHSPAAIRPDPDTYVRRMLKQYRPDGVTLARQIGHVEQYRLLLGGATEDFAKAPQETYDATSLLAVFKVAEEVCRGLVAPNSVEHEGWTTILPFPAADEAENIAWLAQRFQGKPQAKIDAETTTGLAAIMQSETTAIAAEWWSKNNDYAKYVPVCATLALDADALYL